MLLSIQFLQYAEIFADRQTDGLYPLHVCVHRVIIDIGLLSGDVSTKRAVLGKTLAL